MSKTCARLIERGAYLARPIQRDIYTGRADLRRRKRMTNSKETVRVAAVGDIHCGKTSQGAFQPLFAQAAELADVLVLCGDLTDYGLPEEAHILAKEIAAGAKIPIVAVLGNHDYESGKPDEIR